MSTPDHPHRADAPRPPRPEPVLVTGSGGLLGQALVPHLEARGHEVRRFRGDLRDDAAVRDAVRGVAAVYHLAAVTHKWLPDPRLFQQVNVDAAVRLARTAAHAGVERIVHVSSFTVFGPSPGDGSPIATNAPIEPERLQNEYQRSKARAHLALTSLARAEGLPVVLACPGILYGPADLRHRNPVNEIIHRQLRGRLRVWPGGGRGIWTFAFLPDVVAGLLAARRLGAPGEALALGGPAQPLADVFAWLARTSGRPAPRAIPLRPILLAGRVLEVVSRVTRRAPRLSAAALRLLDAHWNLRTDQTSRRLGVTHTPLTTGLVETWRSLHALGIVSQPPPAAVPPA